MHVTDFLTECINKSSSKTNEQKMICTLWASCNFCVLLISINYVGDHLLDIPIKLVPIGVVV